MTVKEVVAKLNATLVCGDNVNRSIDNFYCGDLLSWVMGNAGDNCCWFTIMNNVNVSAVAKLLDCACVVLCEGVIADNIMLEKVKENNINLIYYSGTVYNAVKEINK